MALFVFKRADEFWKRIGMKNSKVKRKGLTPEL
jgi:hypothetical protein